MEMRSLSGTIFNAFHVLDLFMCVSQHHNLITHRAIARVSGALVRVVAVGVPLS